MSDERICHECGTRAVPSDRYCGECGHPLQEPATSWPTPSATERAPGEPSAFIPLDLPPDTGVEEPPRSSWFGNLLRSRTA